MHDLSYIENYGKNLLKNNPEIKKTRFIGQIDNYIEFSDEILEKIFSEIFSEKNIYIQNKNKYKIVERINKKGYSMKWHIDDCQILKHSNKLLENKKNNLTNQFFISPRHSICYNNVNSIPIFSLIIYESEYDIDFTGGTLEFIDGTKIFPKKGLYIFFDSREVHRVNLIKDGIRKNILIKFYK